MITDPSFEFVCQMGHFLAGACLMLASVRIFGDRAEWWALGVGVVLAAWKEGWYDVHHESLTTSGGEAGGWRDFAFYLSGLAIGVLVLNV